MSCGRHGLDLGRVAEEALGVGLVGEVHQAALDVRDLLLVREILDREVRDELGGVGSDHGLDQLDPGALAVAPHPEQHERALDVELGHEQAGRGVEERGLAVVVGHDLREP